MKKIWAVVGVSTVVIVGLVVGGTGGAVAAYEQGKKDAAVSVTKQRLAVEFDRGMKAGVEYEEWFCANPQEVD